MAAVGTLSTAGLGHDFIRPKMYNPHYDTAGLPTHPHTPMAMSSLSASMLQSTPLPVAHSQPPHHQQPQSQPQTHSHAYPHHRSSLSQQSLARDSPTSPLDIKSAFPTATSTTANAAATANAASSITGASLAAASATPSTVATSSHSITIRQQPQNARVAIGKEKDRKPIDPPPILQLTIARDKDPQQHYLQSPYFFMSCTLVGADEQPLKDIPSTSIVGSLASSLHKLKDTDNSDAGFFIFPDLSVKAEGKFRLRFSLFEFQGSMCSHIASISSDVFTVWPAKTFPGMTESTFLTRSFSDQGVRLRLRKDSRASTSRKRPRIQDYPTLRYAPRARTAIYDPDPAALPRMDGASGLVAASLASVQVHDATPVPSQAAAAAVAASQAQAQAHSSQTSTPRQPSFSSPYPTYDTRLPESRGAAVSRLSASSQPTPYYYGSSYVASSSYPATVSVSSGLELQGLGAVVASSMYPSHNPLGAVAGLGPYATDAYGQHQSSPFATTTDHDLHFRAV
ncbi:developmental regulator [Ceratocystis lukuohia]|uniref:Developmental regulator n=1 Tax=Ceratocystis lukuohia TaxID=2019550 RepID=A0ABR4MPV4_9PEZI